MERISQQELARLGELAVEAELVKQGWLVGNFNASIRNAAMYDIFAVKGRHKATLRVKAFRLNEKLVGSVLYSTKKDGEIFLGLDERNKSDISVLAGIKDGNPKFFYVVPTLLIDKQIKEHHSAWMATPRRDGSKHKDSTLRQIIFDDNTDRISRGYKVKWKSYKNNWELLKEIK